MSELSIWEKLAEALKRAAKSFSKTADVIKQLGDGNATEYHHPSGQEQRRERRAKERKLTQVNKKRNAR